LCPISWIYCTILEFFKPTGFGNCVDEKRYNIYNLKCSRERMNSICFKERNCVDEIETVKINDDV